MRVSGGSHQGYRSRATMPCNVLKHDKADVGSPLLEASPVQVLDHSGDTCFTVVVVTNIPCYPSLDHLYFVFVRLCVGVPCGSGIL